MSSVHPDVSRRWETMCRVVTVGYFLFLTYVLVTPFPLWGMGETGAQIEESIDLTVSGFMQHFIAYALLAVLFILSLRRKSWGNIVLCVAAAGLHGLLAEGVQTFIPLRCCDWPDALANFFGAGGAGLIAMLVVALTVRKDRLSGAV